MSRIHGALPIFEAACFDSSLAKGLSLIFGTSSLRPHFPIGLLVSCCLHRLSALERQGTAVLDAHAPQ